MEIVFHHVHYQPVKNPMTHQVPLIDINITCPDRKITGILGTSGSGKSKLIQMVNGLVMPSGGWVSIGESIVGRGQTSTVLNQLRRQIGLVFQYPDQQFIKSTIRDELAFFSKEATSDELMKNCIACLKQVGLDESYLDDKITNLSTGELRKVAIASALVSKPEILLLDEPTLGLDDEGTETLIRILKYLKSKKKMTIVIASHDSEFLYRLVDQVYVIDQGNIVLEGNRNKVFQDVDTLTKCGLVIPKIIWFSNLVQERKQIKLGYRDQMNDLIKDIYRNAR